MVRRLEGHDARPAGGRQGGLERDLDRFGAGGGEEDLRIVHRRQADEPVRERDPQRVGVHVAQAVKQAAGLAAHRGDHPRMAVAHGGDSEAGGQIDVAVAVDVPDVGAARRLPEDRRFGAKRLVDGVDAGRLEARELEREGPRAGAGGRVDDPGELVAGAAAGTRGHISRRPARERPRVTSSVYSMSPPTGMPNARRVTRRPRGLSSRAR